AATSTFTTVGDHPRALTARHPIKPTSRRCPSAWQPNTGRRSTYRRGDSVQTTGTTSKFSRLPCTVAGSTLRVLDGYGLRGKWPARPTLAPCIRFLSINSHVCSALPSDPASRRQPLRIANPSPPSGSVEDFHLQATEHARHTTKSLRDSSPAEAVQLVCEHGGRG